MMATRDLYQNFGVHLEPNDKLPDRPVEELEDEKLQAFEAGYQAGWDDSTKAQADLSATVSSTLAANLQDASFQYHEMRSQLTRSMREMMQAIVEKVLPDMARKSLGAHVVQLVETQTRQALEANIEIHVHPDNLEQVERVIANVSIECSLVPSARTAPEQLFIRIGENEQSIDLERVIQEIHEAVAAFFEVQNEEVADDRPT